MQAIHFDYKINNLYISIMNVLIVEDEMGLAKEMSSFLVKEGYACEIVHTGQAASEKMYIGSYDFILLDLGLPDYDGLDLLKEAREDGKDSAVIILTARDGLNDKLKGLNMGADDYLAKPFSLLELLSRMNAITRRKFGLQKNTLIFNGFVLDIQNHSLHYQNTLINLTKKEFDILYYLLLHKNRVVTRMQLTEHIWGDILEDDYDSNYIAVHIKNLRKKLMNYSNEEVIETVRGIGYKISII